MSEEWRVCPFNNNYQVSSIGRVRRATFSPNRKSKPGDIIAPQRDGRGYMFVSLWQNAKSERHSIHRLVAFAFIGTPPTVGHEVAHRDGNPGHNAVANLRWATRSENHADKALHGTQQHGEANGHSKLTADQVRDILSHPITCNRSALARKHGVSQVTVTRIIRRELWKHIDLKEIA